MFVIQSLMTFLVIIFFTGKVFAWSPSKADPNAVQTLCKKSALQGDEGDALVHDILKTLAVNGFKSSDFIDVISSASRQAALGAELQCLFDEDEEFVHQFFALLEGNPETGLTKEKMIEVFFKAISGDYDGSILVNLAQGFMDAFVEEKFSINTEAPKFIGVWMKYFRKRFAANMGLPNGNYIRDFVMSDFMDETITDFMTSRAIDVNTLNKMFAEKSALRQFFIDFISTEFKIPPKVVASAVRYILGLTSDTTKDLNTKKVGTQLSHIYNDDLAYLVGEMFKGAPTLSKILKVFLKKDGLGSLQGAITSCYENNQSGNLLVQKCIMDKIDTSFRLNKEEFVSAISALWNDLFGAPLDSRILTLLTSDWVLDVFKPGFCDTSLQECLQNTKAMVLKTEFKQAFAAFIDVYLGFTSSDAQLIEAMLFTGASNANIMDAMIYGASGDYMWTIPVLVRIKTAVSQFGMGIDRSTNTVFAKYIATFFKSQYIPKLFAWIPKTKSTSSSCGFPCPSDVTVPTNTDYREYFKQQIITNSNELRDLMANMLDHETDLDASHAEALMNVIFAEDGVLANVFKANIKLSDLLTKFQQQLVNAVGTKLPDWARIFITDNTLQQIIVKLEGPNTLSARKELYKLMYKSTTERFFTKLGAQPWHIPFSRQKIMQLTEAQSSVVAKVFCSATTGVFKYLDDMNNPRIGDFDSVNYIYETSIMTHRTLISDAYLRNFAPQYFQTFFKSTTMVQIAKDIKGIQNTHSDVWAFVNSMDWQNLMEGFMQTTMGMSISTTSVMIEMLWSTDAGMLRSATTYPSAASADYTNAKAFVENTLKITRTEDRDRLASFLNEMLKPSTWQKQKPRLISMLSGAPQFWRTFINSAGMQNIMENWTNSDWVRILDNTDVGYFLVGLTDFFWKPFGGAAKSRAWVDITFGANGILQYFHSTSTAQFGTKEAILYGQNCYKAIINDKDIIAKMFEYDSDGVGVKIFELMTTSPRPPDDIYFQNFCNTIGGAIGYSFPTTNKFGKALANIMAGDTPRDFWNNVIKSRAATTGAKIMTFIGNHKSVMPHVISCWYDKAKEPFLKSAINLAFPESLSNNAFQRFYESLALVNGKVLEGFRSAVCPMWNLAKGAEESVLLVSFKFKKVTCDDMNNAGKKLILAKAFAKTLGVPIHRISVSFPSCQTSGSRLLLRTMRGLTTDTLQAQIAIQAVTPTMKATLQKRTRKTGFHKKVFDSAKEEQLFQGTSDPTGSATQTDIDINTVSCSPVSSGDFQVSTQPNVTVPETGCVRISILRNNDKTEYMFDLNIATKSSASLLVAFSSDPYLPCPCEESDAAASTEFFAYRRLTSKSDLSFGMGSEAFSGCASGDVYAYIRDLDFVEARKVDLTVANTNICTEQGHAAPIMGFGIMYGVLGLAFGLFVVAMIACCAYVYLGKQRSVPGSTGGYAKKTKLDVTFMKKNPINANNVELGKMSSSIVIANPVNAAAPPPPPTDNGEWVKYTDPSTGKPYWNNGSESRWDNPNA